MTRLLGHGLQVPKARLVKDAAAPGAAEDGHAVFDDFATTRAHLRLPERQHYRGDAYAVVVTHSTPPAAAPLERGGALAPSLAPWARTTSRAAHAARACKALSRAVDVPTSNRSTTACRRQSGLRGKCCRSYRSRWSHG